MGDTKYVARPADHDAMKEDLAWRKVPSQNNASLTFLPSEDVSQWPEGSRRKMESGEEAKEEEERGVGNDEYFSMIFYPPLLHRINERSAFTRSYASR